MFFCVFSCFLKRIFFEKDLIFFFSDRCLVEEFLGDTAGLCGGGKQFKARVQPDIFLSAFNHKPKLITIALNER